MHSGTNTLRKQIIRIITLIALISGSYLYGILTYRNHLFPYNMLEPMNNTNSMPQRANNLQAELKQYHNIQVEELISIKSSDDIYKVRSMLIKFFWGRKGIPTDKPPLLIQSKGKGELFKSISSIERIDKLIVKMAFGLESHIFHFLPKDNNGKIILFHQGHRNYYMKGRHLKQFLDRGYSVVVFCMPLLCLNSRPSVVLPRLGQINITSHDQMRFIKIQSGHQLKFFIEPVVVMLNYLQKNYEYRHIAMIGISGGGWTTTLAAAIDDRINSSFPVAGSYPIYLRSGSSEEWGDWEETVTELYNTINYFEIYILGGYGVGREQVQVINKYDPCCFSGIKWQTYSDIVRRRIQELGVGKWDLFLDDTHYEHQISDGSMKMILSILKNK